MRLPTLIEAALEETGQPWVIKMGGKHIKLLVAGRLAGVLPKNGGNESDRRAVHNTVRQIRNVARELRQ